MRFRAEVRWPLLAPRRRKQVTNVKTFIHIAESINKLSKRCTVKFAPDRVYLICAPNAGGAPASADDQSGTQVWACVA